MKRFAISVAALMLVGLVWVPATATADEPEETVYDFEAENLEGNLLRPDGEQISGDDRGRTSSLINIREDFIPEMLESVESL